MCWRIWGYYVWNQPQWLLPLPLWEWRQLHCEYTHTEGFVSHKPDPGWIALSIMHRCDTESDPQWIWLQEYKVFRYILYGWAHEGNCLHQCPLSLVEHEYCSFMSQDMVNGYQCDCAPGWTGHRCGTEIDECSSYPCQNNGTCFVSVNYYIINDVG